MPIRARSACAAVCLFLVSAPLALADLSIKASPDGPRDAVTSPVETEWTYSIDGGKTFAADAPVVTKGQQQEVVLRGVFHVDDPEKVAGLYLRHEGKSAVVCTGQRRQMMIKVWHFNQGIENTRVTLGGKPLTGSVATTCYYWMPLDPSGLISKGKNTLEVRGTFFNATLPEPAKLFPKLAAAVPQAPKILHGPVLGSLDAEYFSVTCKTGAPAKVTVRATDAARPESATTASSGGGYYHRLKIPLPKGARKVSYRVTAELAGKKSTVGPFSFHLPRGPAGHLKFVVIGNTRCHHLYTKHTGPKLAAAMLAQKPDLFLHAGQVSEFPWWDFYWEPAFFEPYRKLVRTVPTYLVGPEFREHSGGAKAIFYTPASEGHARTWTQVIQGVRIIAIDGIQDWSAASNNTKWLDTVLSESKEKYVFVFDHFPGYASGKLSRPPLFRPMAQAREVIHPLLAKHKATALISACEFEYERSEPKGDKGVPQIVIGGGGAKYYAQSGRATRNNPFIKVYHRRHGFCLFEVQGEKCLMRAIDIDGVEMDRRTFAPR